MKIRVAFAFFLLPLFAIGQDIFQFSETGAVIADFQLVYYFKNGQIKAVHSSSIIDYESLSTKSDSIHLIAKGIFKRKIPLNFYKHLPFKIDVAEELNLIELNSSNNWKKVEFGAGRSKLILNSKIYRPTLVSFDLNKLEISEIKKAELLVYRKAYGQSSTNSKIKLFAFYADSVDQTKQYLESTVTIETPQRKNWIKLDLSFLNNDYDRKKLFIGYQEISGGFVLGLRRISEGIEVYNGKVTYYNTKTSTLKDFEWENKSESNYCKNYTCVPRFRLTISR